MWNKSTTVEPICALPCAHTHTRTCAAGRALEYTAVDSTALKLSRINYKMCSFNVECVLLL